MRQILRAHGIIQAGELVAPTVRGNRIRRARRRDTVLGVAMRPAKQGKPVMVATAGFFSGVESRKQP